MQKRKYKGKDVEMLTVGATIIENAISGKEFLTAQRRSWADPFFPDLKLRIDNAFTRYLGTDSASEQRSATRTVLQIQASALTDLSGFKIQIQQDFKSTKPRLTEILKQLGYADFYRQALKKDQEGLVQLLYRFRAGLSPELRTEITSKGIDAEYLDRISSYADRLSQANITQETLKGARKTITEEAVTEFNAIYDAVVSIAKIAHHFYKGNSNKQDGFSYAKILKKLNSHPRSTS
jgi:hypothetical protein